MSTMASRSADRRSSTSFRRYDHSSCCDRHPRTHTRTPHARSSLALMPRLAARAWQKPIRSHSDGGLAYEQRAAPNRWLTRLYVAWAPAPLPGEDNHSNLNCAPLSRWSCLLALELLARLFGSLLKLVLQLLLLFLELLGISRRAVIGLGEIRERNHQA